MSPVAVTLVGLAAGTYLLKAAGPLLLGSRTLPARFGRWAVLLPVPLLAALVATSTLTDDQRWIVDARAVGLAAAAVALWRRLPFIVVVVAAGAATAGARALT